MLRYVFMGTPDFASTILEDLTVKYGPPALVVTQPAREKGRGRIIEETAVGLDGSAGVGLGIQQTTAAQASGDHDERKAG